MRKLLASCRAREVRRRLIAHHSSTKHLRQKQNNNLLALHPKLLEKLNWHDARRPGVGWQRLTPETPEEAPLGTSIGPDPRSERPQLHHKPPLKTAKTAPGLQIACRVWAKSGSEAHIRRPTAFLARFLE